VDQGEEPRQPGDDTTPHRFPAPWSVRELEQAFVVLNAYNPVDVLKFKHGEATQSFS
jgi:hypothetical protein